MMGVVVDDRHAAGLGDLEPPARAREPRERRPRPRPRLDARELERGERRCPRSPVVLAGQRRARPRTAARRGRRRSARAAPAVELASSSASERELGVVVELDVRDHGDHGREAEHRPVGLVALDDEPALPRTRRCCRAAAPVRRSATPGRARSRAGRTRSSPPSSPCRACRRRRRRAAARRARRGTPRATRPATPGTPTRRRPPSRRARPARRDELDREPAERGEVRRLDAIPAADLGPPRARELRVRREPGAADADEPEPAPVKRPQARSALGDLLGRVRAAPPAASPRPSAPGAAGRRAASGRGRARRRGRGRAP